MLCALSNHFQCVSSEQCRKKWYIFNCLLRAEQKRVRQDKERLLLMFPPR